MPQTSDYINLVTSFYRNKPDFTAFVTVLVDYFTALQTVINNLPNDFDLDFAVGVQLDAVGLWVGRTRNINVPLPDSWFRFDDTTRGFDAGIWWGPYATPEGRQVLDDDTFRTLLRAKILANEWDGTVPGAQAAFVMMFSAIPNSGLVFVDDTGQNKMIVGVAQNIPTLLMLALIVDDWLPIKPAGIERLFRVISSQSTFGVSKLCPLFGFDVSNQYIGGFDQASWGVDPNYYINGGKPVPLPAVESPQLDFSKDTNSQYIPTI